MYEYRIIKSVTMNYSCYKKEVTTFKRLNKAKAFVESLIPSDAKQLCEDSKFGHWYDVRFINNIGNYIVYTIYSNKQ